MATASSISPSGMKIAGKYGIGVLSIASNSLEGLQALPTQWGFAEESARQHGKTVDRKDWRVLMAWHLAETREQARNESVQGLHRWHNEYNVRVLGRPDPSTRGPVGLMARSREAGCRWRAAVADTRRHVCVLTSLYDKVGGSCRARCRARWANREAKPVAGNLRGSVPRWTLTRGEGVSRLPRGTRPTHWLRGERIINRSRVTPSPRKPWP